eukprot:11497004-Alexandrium_andersonii.AAC.1
MRRGAEIVSVARKSDKVLRVSGLRIRLSEGSFWKQCAFHSASIWETPSKMHVNVMALPPWNWLCQSRNHRIASNGVLGLSTTTWERPALMDI